MMVVRVVVVAGMCVKLSFDGDKAIYGGIVTEELRTPSRAGEGVFTVTLDWDGTEHEVEEAFARFAEATQSDRERLKAVLALSATEVDPRSAEKPYRPLDECREALATATPIGAQP